jgi:hypothetical protein
MITRGTYRNPFDSLRKNFLAAFLSLQNTQHVAVLIYCTPEVMEASVVFEEHLIQVPPVAGSRRLMA